MPPELSDESRETLRAASEFAREHGSEFVETEHLLLALLTESDRIVNALLSAGHSGNGSRAALDRILSELQECMPPSGDLVARGKIPLSPIARQAVAFAEEEAKNLGADRIEPSHLLIGLLREERGLACEVLDNLGYNAGVLREQFVFSPEFPSPGPPAQPINGSHEGLIETLIDFESGMTYLERADDARVYIPRNDGWQAHIKRGWDKLYCYLKHPGDDAFHLILNGEIFLQRGDEKYCLDCALRHDFATRDRLFWQRRKRQPQAE